MRKLEDGKIEIHSQFEAWGVGRLAVYGTEDTELSVRHSGYSTPPKDEVEFLARSRPDLTTKNNLVLSKHRSQLAEAAIQHIVSTGETYNGINLALAQAMARALLRSSSEHVAAISDDYQGLNGLETPVSVGDQVLLPEAAVAV